MIETCKITGQKYDQDCVEGIFQMKEDDTTRGNTKKIYKTRARLDLRKYSFSNRVVDIWNDLPEWVVKADTIEKFEHQLDRVWAGQDRKYEYRARITTRNQRHGSAEVIELEPQA